MKQSTFSAVMANSIKNLLQGYTKGIRFVAVLMVLLTMGIGQAWGAEKTITLTYSSFGLTTSYAQKTATVDGIGFTVNQGYKGTNDVIQMNNSKGTGTLYNTTSITGLKSITINVSSGSKTYTITSGTSQNPTGNSQTGTATKTFSIPSGDTYFQLKVSGASYFSSIVITYDDGNSGGGSDDCTWQLVTDASSLAAGDEIVIAAKDYSYAISTSQNDNNRGQAAITKSESTIFEPSESVQILTLEAGKTVGSLAFNTGKGYLYAASSSKNYLKTESNLSNNSSWTISIAANGTATLTAQGTNSRNVMQYNQSSSIFACYSSASQKALVIYKKVCATQTCDAYSFHTGSDDDREKWLKEAIKCFTKEGGYEHEWQIKDYIIPNDDDKFFVGYYGYFYNDNLGIGGANGKSRSVVSDWGNMYLAPAMDENDAPGTPRLGHAKGAKGTLRIFEDSNWDNLYVGFIPDGYKLKFGTTEYAFTHKENSEYLSDIVEYNATSANYNASAGITNVSGDYVVTDHTQEMRHIFVKDNIGWRNDGAKLAIYYWNGSTNGWCGFLKTVPGDATLFEGWIPASYTSLKFVRFSNTKGAVGDWNDKWNETGDLTISSGNNLFTITDWGTGSWSAYSRKGKFRIYNDSKDKNWYLHFYPHNVLIYDANSGSGTMASQSVPADATSKSVTVSANGFTRSGYRFTGWNTKANGSGTPYAAGASLNLTSDITLYAQWAQEFTVTYNANGGTTDCEDDNTYIQDETVIVCSTNPSQTGHTFLGWSDGTNTYSAGATFTMPAKDVTLTAQWQINQYTVTLNPNYPAGKTGTFKDKDGNTVSGNLVLTYDYNTPSQTLTDLYKSIKLDGHRFDGWYSATSGGSIWTSTGTITKNVTVYAQWTKVDCRWIETDIANILPEDEVVVAMQKIGSKGIAAYYALNNNGGTTSNPQADTITVEGNVILYNVATENIWNIAGDATNGYTLYPNGSESTWLYCNKSNNEIRVGKGAGKIFTIKNGYLYHLNMTEIWEAYLGVSFNTNPYSWRHYDDTTSVIVNQTLKFYKRVCVDESNPWYTVTFNAGSGSCDTVSLTGTKNGGITLPTATPSDACDTDGWVFAGWWTDEVIETTTSPGELLTAGSNYKPDEEGKILYAVYSKEETSEGGDPTPIEATLSFASTAQRTSFSTTQQIWEQNGIILTNNKAASTSPVADYANPARFYANSEIIIEAPRNITQIVFDCNSDSYATAMENSIDAETSVSGDKVTLKLGGTSNTYTVSSISAQVRIDALTVTYLAESGPTITTTYNSNPSCEACENILTISKGEETNGNTFTLSQIDDIETCDGEVEVVVTPTPTEHYSVSEVTATTPTTGGTPTITDNGNGTWTVTYAQDSKGESTISVTFVEDAKATITLSELDVETTDNTTYYVGEQYTLPTTSSQSCEGKELVGWSTVEVAETDIKPTEDYYERGAEVTLAATQTFYAVYATSGEGGGGEYTLVTSANDFTDGVYVIAALDNGTYYFIDGNGEYKGLGVEVNGLAASEVNNGSFSELSLPSGSVEIEFEDDGEPLDGNHYYFVSYYDETISNWKFLDDDRTNATLKWVEWDDGLAVYTYHPVFDTKTYLISGSGAAISQNGSTKASFIRNYENGSTYNNLYFFKKSGSTNTYTAYTTSCVPTYTITYDFAGGTGSHCSNTTVPQGESYTICEDEPTKTGYTFLHWSDGTTTYAAGVTIKPTSDITLTAVWQINTYTVTWSNNGATDEVTYNHGESLVVPTDIASCDGVKEFVGWTTQSGYYHATEKPDDLFTTKTEVVTATATYYAVFATPGGTGSTNVTTTLDFSAQGYNNEQAISSLTVNGVIATLAKGTNADNGPKYYNSGTAVRTYGGNTIKLSANNITAVTFTFGSGETHSNTISANTGGWEEPNWTGDAVNELVFTISGSSGHRRIQSIDVTHTTGSTAAHTDYTTICRQVESIEVTNPKTEFFITDDFTIGEGKVMAQFGEGEPQDVTSLATFSGYNMNEVGTYTVTVTYMGATATYNIEVKPLDNAWVLTWNVSGKTNTGLRPRQVTKGSAIGKLPVPEVPAACEGKNFIGWTESNTVPSDGVGIVYITSETVPTGNTTYYAVFATVNNFSIQKPITDITSGSKVVIVAVASMDDTGSTGKAISSRTISITSQGVIGLDGDEVSIFDETINTPHSTCIWTLKKNGATVTFEQGDKYIKATDSGYRKLVLDVNPDYWTLIPVAGKDKTYHMQSGNTSHYVEWFDHTDSKYDEGERYIGFVPYTSANNLGDFDMQFFVVAGDGADITDYTTGCTEYTITYYGFRGGYSTSTSSNGIIILPVNSAHTVPDCGDVVKDHTDLGREFLNLWMTEPHGGHTFKPGDTFILTQDTTLYAQWKLETTADVTLPTGVEDLAGTDVYVYGGNTLTMVPDVVTINSLVLKGGLQPDGSYQMPNVWIPDGATLVRNTNKIYLDLAINAKNWYPFAVPFATKNDQYLDYLDPVLRDASTYGTHFAIKTYNGARRAEFGEDRANNWKQLLRHTGGTTSYLEPGVGYIISAMTKSGEDTATIRIPMTVPNTWFENGEQTVVGSTSRNTIAVTAHTGAAATEHRRHAGWNFIASPYLSEFAGNKVDNGGTYINGWINIANQYNYEDTEIPYVTIPVYDFAYYEQKKVSEATLSPEWSFFVQIAVDGTIDFVEEGRQTAPAGIAARTQEERPVKMDIDINLTDGRSTDQMGIIVCEKYSDAYEIGRDLEKMFGSAYNLVVYSLMNDNTPLAYQAVPLLNETHAIPIGYRAPEQGEYTFSLKQNTSSIDLLNEQYEQLVLVDYEKGALTNLLNSDYTFSSERTQSNSRFALYAVPRQDSSTELPNISDEEDAIRKIFYNGHLFIIRNGNVYNGNGQIVK